MDWLIDWLIGSIFDSKILLFHLASLAGKTNSRLRLIETNWNFKIFFHDDEANKIEEEKGIKLLIIFDQSINWETTWYIQIRKYFLKMGIFFQHRRP
jgi:hypothetical protein